MTRRRTLLLGAGAVALLLAALIGVVAATSGSSADDLVVYSARSHYGEEAAFKDFAERRDVNVTLFGGSASELYERIKSEGERTRADVLITVDGANLWRAQEEGLLEPYRSKELGRHVPRGLRDPAGHWYAVTARARTIARSTKRVRPGVATTYEGLGDPRWKGKLCLRSGTSEYNVSFVADRLAKHGPKRTERMLRRWMANDPEVLGSDVDVLEAIEEGRCDVGLVNSYYLGRELEEDPDFPVALEWADQGGRGTHVNLSGIGVVRGAEHRDLARELLLFLTAPAQQQTFARNNHELAADPAVKPTPEIARFGDFKRDPIDVARAGERLDDALRLMEKVGWG